MMKQANEHNFRRIRIDEVLSLTSIRSRSTIWKLTKEGSFPPPYKISKRAVAWKLSDIVEWLDSRPLAHESAEEWQ